MFRNADRRRDVRIGARVAVKFKVEEAAKALNTFSVNFSAGGLCLRTKIPHAVGARLELSLDVDGQLFELKGQVAWSRGDVIGVRFEGVTQKDRERLEAVAKVLAKSNPLVR